ncbi:MAG TPA: hypothetical protein VK213_03630 [Bacteroidales bacterium]|nr:hypothetical protein [Bacteroidales bacterium]
MKKSKKQFYLVIIAVILLTVLVLLMIFKNHDPFGKNNTAFAVSPENDITRIEFSGESGKLILEEVESKWLLNGKLETRKSSISFITRVMHEIEIKSPVSEEIFNSEITEKGLEPVRVKAYNGRKQVADFLVYKTSSNVYGNIMKKKASSKPYIVHVPGYDGEIGSAFSMNVLYWQPYTIFNLLPSEILSVTMQISDSADSFKISRENNKLILSDGNKIEGIDSTLVNRYISYFTFIPFESWALGLSTSEKQSITSQTPVYVLTVTTNDNRSISLKLWERRSSDGRSDTDRLYGKTDGSDELFIVRYYDIDPVLKKRSYFFNR